MRGRITRVDVDPDRAGRGVRPPPPDQPTAEETAALVAGLRVAVLSTDAQVVRGPGGRRVLLRPAGATTVLLHVEGDRVLGEREIDTRELINHLTAHGQTYEVLGGLVPATSPSA